LELTTGALLRRITETPLSTSAHKLATIILDGVAWKEGYNGLERGTAAFTLAHLAEKTGVSRQHLTLLLGELAASALGLVRWKPHGKFAPWLFRFGSVDSVPTDPDLVSAADDTSLSRDSKNKMMFFGKIDIAATANVYSTPWAGLIKAAKSALPCWNVDTQVIWDAFCTFNRARGHEQVPAGYLLGFLRKWRVKGSAPRPVVPSPTRLRTLGNNDALMKLICAAPIRNRQFHASDLRRLIGQAAYDQRVQRLVRQFGCSTFSATLAVHGCAVLAGEILK
jgi:hypothetical protein